MKTIRQLFVLPCLPAPISGLLGTAPWMSAGLASLVTLTGNVSTSLAEAVVLAPVADTAIFSLNPDNNYGGLTTVPVGPIAKAGHVGRALVRFDVASAVPRDAVVTNVTLTVQVAKEATIGNRDRVELHRLLTDWAEGSKSEGSHGSTATAGEANWGWRRFGNATWSSPGATTPFDMVRTPSAWVNWNNPGSYTLVTLPAMIADVQRWIDTPISNHGWLLKSATESSPGTAKRIVTREGPAEQRPRLVIEFTPPPVTAPQLTGQSLPDGTLELSCRLNPGSRCELRVLDDLSATNYTMLTNYSAGTAALEARFVTTPSAAQRFYRLVEN